MYAVVGISRLKPGATAKVAKGILGGMREAPGFVSGTVARSTDGERGRNMMLFESEDEVKATLEGGLRGESLMRISSASIRLWGTVGGDPLVQASAFGAIAQRFHLGKECAHRGNVDVCNIKVGRLKKLEDQSVEFGNFLDRGLNLIGGHADRFFYEVLKLKKILAGLIGRQNHRHRRRQPTRPLPLSLPT